MQKSSVLTTHLYESIDVVSAEYRAMRNVVHLLFYGSEIDSVNWLLMTLLHSTCRLSSIHSLQASKDGHFLGMDADALHITYMHKSHSLIMQSAHTLHSSTQDQCISFGY